MKDVLVDITHEIGGEEKQVEKQVFVDSTSFAGAFMILFNEMIPLPFNHWFYWGIQYFIPIIHLFCLMISPHLSACWKDNSDAKYLACVMSFSPTSLTNEFDVIPTSIMCVILLLEMIVALVVPATYKQKRYPRAAVAVEAAITQVFLPLLIIPFTVHVTYLFDSLQTGVDVADVLLLVFFLAVLVLALAMVRFMAQMNCFLLLPNKSPIATYEGKHPAMSLIGACAYIVLSALCALFEKWLLAIVMFLDIAFLCYLVYDLFQFPFVKEGTHPFAAAVYIGTMVGHIMNAIYLFGLDIPDLVRICVPYGVFVISYFIMICVFRKMVAKTCLMLSQTECQTDAERREYFDSLEITKQSDLDRMCRIGMTKFCPLVIDWTFLLYAGRFQNDLQSLLNSGLYVSFFPGEQQASCLFIEEISKHTHMSFVQRYANYRMRLLNHKRFSNDSEDATALYAHAREMTASLIMSISDFWNKVVSSPDMVNQADIEDLATKRGQTKSLWKEGLKQFPNDSRFANGYAHFLFECDVDVEQGALMKLKSGHMAKGFTGEVDPVFRAFAIARPMLIRNNICDKLGNIKHSAFEISHGTTMTISTAALEKLEEDIDSGMADKLIQELFHWPNLRKSLAKATTNYRPKLYNLAVGLLIVALFLFVAYLITLGIVTLPIVSAERTFFDRIDATRDVDWYITLSRMLAMLLWASETNTLFDSYMIALTLPPEVYLEEGQIVQLQNMAGQMRERIQDLTDSYLHMIDHFATYMRTHDDITRSMESLLNNSVKTYICANGNSVVPGGISVSLRTAVISILYHLRSMSTDPIDWMTFNESDTLCQFATTSATVSNACINAMDVCFEEFIEENEKDRYILDTCLWVSFVFIFVVFLPLMHVILIVYTVETSTVLDAIKSLPPEAARQSTESLIAGDQETQEDVIEHLISGGADTRSKKAYFVLAHILVLALFIFFVVAYLILQLEHNKANVNYIFWNFSGSLRNSKVCLIVAQVMYGLLLMDFPTTYSSGGVELSRISTVVNQLLDVQRQYYHGNGQYPGIKGFNKRIDEINTIDMTCQSDGRGTQHELYACLCFERKISTLQTYTSQVTNATKINSSLVLDIMHMSNSEMARDLTEMHDILSSSLDEAELVTNALSAVCIAGGLLAAVGMICTLAGLMSRLKKLIKMQMILIRRIPPPALANCHVIRKLLLGPHKDKAVETNSIQIIFNKLPTPALTISEDETIEAMNDMAKEVFGYLNGQIVGQKLDCLIRKRDATDEDAEMTEAEIGSEKLYTALTNMQVPDCTDLEMNTFVDCRCADDSMIPCKAALFGVKDISGLANNFILFLHDTREDEHILKEIQAAKDEVLRLMNQLIPSDVRGFIRDDRTDFTFVSKCATAVAIQICGFHDMLRRTTQENLFEQIHKLFSIFEVECVRHPPVMRQKHVGDVFLAVSGLFIADEPKVKAQAAVQFACDAVDEALRMNDPDSDENLHIKVQVGIATGGPLLCGLSGDEVQTFDASGKVIEEAMYLADLSYPNHALCCERTKEVLPNTEFDPGPTIDGFRETFYLANFIDKELIAAYNRTNTTFASMGTAVRGDSRRSSVFPSGTSGLGK